MALTRYKVLRRRSEDGFIEELSSVDGHGVQHALRVFMTANQPVTGKIPLAGETLIAVPESNWSELVPQAKQTTTISFLEPDGSVAEAEPEAAS